MNVLALVVGMAIILVAFVRVRTLRAMLGAIAVAFGFYLFYLFMTHVSVVGSWFVR